MVLEELRLTGGRERYPAERMLLEELLRAAGRLTLLAAELPLRCPLARTAADLLEDSGPCFTFRARGEDRDRERFAERLWQFWRELEEPEGAGEPPARLGLSRLLEAQPAGDCYVLVDEAHRLTGDLGELLEQLMARGGDKLHVLLLSGAPISFLRQADALPRRAAAVTPASLILDAAAAGECLRRGYPALMEEERALALRLSGGWVSALDAVAEHLAAEGGAGRRALQDPEEVLPEVGDLLDQWAAAWGEETLDCMERLCVEERLSEGLALALTEGRTGPLRALARTRFLVRTAEGPETAYLLNPALRAWLYQRARRERGKGFLLEQHRLAAAYGQAHEDWQLVFRHQLRRGYLEEAALTLRHLGFSELDAALLGEFRQLMRRQPPAAMERLPWVQLGYAIAMKYRHPSITLRSLDRAIESFRAAGDREGVVLACCQKLSMAFFVPEQKGLTAEALGLLTEADAAGGELEPLLDGYRKVFTAYALIQQGRDYQRAIDLLEQAQEAAIIREDRNLRLWVCFMMILTYKDCQYANGLRAALDEAMELAEAPEVQKPLKMCVYQTVAFLCYTEGGRYGEACACCERAARIAEEIEAYGYSVYINMIHSYALDCLGRFQRAEEVILETGRVSGAILNVRNEHLWAYYLIGQSYHYFLKGDWGLALDTAEKAVRYATRSGRVSYLLRALLVLGNILVDHGRCDRAEALAEQCLDLCRQKQKYQFYQLSALFLQAQIDRRRGRGEDFAAHMAQLARGSRAAGIYHYNFARPADICQVFRDYDPPEEDRGFVRQLLSYNQLEDGRAPVLEEAGPAGAVEVRILGPLAVAAEGEALGACASAKAAQLLRLLALHGEAVSIHRLLEAVWPDWDEKSAMNNFYFTLYQLRAYLGKKEAVLYRRGMCALDPEMVTVDAARFRRLAARARQYLDAGDLYAADRYFAQAAALCRGPVLDGDDLPEDAVLQREALEREVYAALRDYGVTCLRRRRPDKAEPILARAARSPFSDEGAIRLLMAAQYLSGNKSGALATGERLREQLRADLGVEPHRLTRELEDRIRRNREVADLLSLEIQ